METLVKFGSPFVLDSVGVWIFLLLPALGALVGAFAGQGSYRRIVTAAAGAGMRDAVIIGLFLNGRLSPNNHLWSVETSFMLLYLSAASAALLACLAPYRGKLLLFNAAVGGFAGQFILPYLLGLIHTYRARQRSVDV